MTSLTPYQWLKKYDSDLAMGCAAFQAALPNSSEQSLAQEKIKRAVQGIFRTAFDIAAQEQEGKNLNASKQLLAVCMSHIKAIEEMYPDSNLRWTVDTAAELALSLLAIAGLYALTKAEHRIIMKSLSHIELFCNIPGLAKATIISLSYFSTWYTAKALLRGDRFAWLSVGSSVAWTGIWGGLSIIFHPYQTTNAIKQRIFSISRRLV